MTDTNDKPKRRRNPAWKDNTKAARQQNRRDRLKQAAQTAGFDTIDQLASAIIDGVAKIVRCGG